MAVNIEEYAYALLVDGLHPLTETETVGEHDETEEEHQHWSILTIGEHGSVIDVDWGYHSYDEASNVLNTRFAHRD